MNLGKRLKELRENQKKTLQEVGDSIGTSSVYISDLEKGKRQNPSIEVLNKLSNYYNVSTDYLLGRNIKKLPLSKNHNNTEVKELLDRYNVYLDGEIITEEDKESVINFLRMLRDRDKKTNKEV